MTIPAPTSAAFGPQQSYATAAGATTTALSSDFNTFLTLLTAQIRNQDPLEPADSTEYVAQLATFSNVEQSVRTNDLLNEMVNYMNRAEVSSAADWIGLEVRHSGPVALAGEAVTLLPEVPLAADRAELVVTDDTGREVQRISFDPRAETIDWSGLDASGAQLGDGIYVLHVEPYAGDLALGAATIAHYARVEEVSLGQVGTELILSGGVRLPATWLESIREPDAG